MRHTHPYYLPKSLKKVLNSLTKTQKIRINEFIIEYITDSHYSWTLSKPFQRAVMRTFNRPCRGGTFQYKLDFSPTFERYYIRLRKLERRAINQYIKSIIAKVIKAKQHGTQEVKYDKKQRKIIGIIDEYSP